METNKPLAIIIISILIILASFFGGYYIGKSTIKVGESTEYVKLPEQKIEDPKIDSSKVIETIPVKNEVPDAILKKLNKLENSNNELTSENNNLKLVNSELFKSNNELSAENNKLTQQIPENIDSNKLWTDYITKRTTTNHIMFDNEYGKYTVSYDVQYNNLQSFYNAKFQPIQKNTKSVIERTWQPFGFISGTTNGDLGLGIGTFYKDIGISGGIEYPAFNTKIETKQWLGRVSIYKKL